MLNWIDRLAGWWIDLRADMALARNPALQKAGFKKAEFDEQGFHLVASFPGVYILADEAAAMLEANNAENYVQFDMLPRADRHFSPIRVTVQWAYGKSPAQRVIEMENLLREWLVTPFFETREEWQTWVAAFGARVREALGEIEEKTGGVGG